MSGIDERLALLERRLRQLESGEAADEGSLRDRVAVLEQLHRLQSAIDARDWDTIRDTFTPDGTGYGRTGVDEILAIMQDHLGGCGPTQHLLGNERVTIEGDRARSLSYARVHHVGAKTMQGKFFECMGEYDDRWVRTENGWRLSRREFDMQIQIGDFTVLRPAALRAGAGSGHCRVTLPASTPSADVAGKRGVQSRRNQGEYNL
ncbi:nuclear transport factor 2 family protein [Streptomyces sp. NPDC057486]|uniref:nuclear transport factor 2 family protein n=1 Tax=Streptomyces sp. NPDC057486 TaxID=3346145 RepID=UPI00369C9017